MISRRNIRVKVMQTLYTVATTEPNDQELNKKTGAKLLDEKLNHSLDLFTISILYITRVAQYAELDARQRASKYLPTQEDLNVSTKIAGNEFLWQVLSNQTFIEKTKEAKITHAVDEEWIKKLYQQLTKTPEYKEYAVEQSRDAKKEKAIIQFIWQKQMLENEALQEHFSEELPHWEDDKEMTEMLMENFFKSNQKINFLNLISAEKREYAHNLMRTVIDKTDYCMEFIKPKLVNWDAERVALIDLLLLRMGVCEMLYFPTIPTKVTINEYIEIAKLYSTPQSGQFVNGVLDNILKDLEKENLINKQERTRKS
ncbi:transcription antitermination factor NusB [Polluticoccus soli]|uniref:transcription antitermination factor NusB n=1 Tax=Polluticoccus soli TaxID=3034150 RepID=UPI0023E2245D|nr:transcription antitermination factor NusB [Flavipsychrobacter sp. JY13-12]